MQQICLADGSIKYKGAHYDGRRKKNPWQSHIRISNRLIHLGCYPTQEAAARAYNKAAKELFGEYAQLNDIE